MTMKNSLKQGKPLIRFARRQGTQRLEIQRLRDSFFSSSPSPPGQTVRGASDAPPATSPAPPCPRTGGPMGDRGLRRAEAGAARLPLRGRRGDRLGSLRCQHQSLRGPSERGPRGGRPLPVVGGGPPRMRGLYRYTLCKRNYSSSGLGRTGRSETSPSGRVALALRVGLREGGNFRGGTLVSLPGKCLSFWIAGPAREELAQTSLERRRLSPRARRVPRTLRARGGAITNTAAGRITRLTVGFLSKNAPPGFRVRRVSCRAPKASPSTRDTFKDSYLVDPASSHMLVSKIKPCMSKYNLYTGKLRMAH